jgi:hypothetical protein
MNVLQHTIDISQNVVVPITQDDISVCFKNFGALQIDSCARTMLTSVNLYNQSPRMTRKVHDVTIDLNLATKVCLRELETMA